MGENRVRSGALIAGVSGAVLLLAMIVLDWYGVEVADFQANAFEAYNFIDFGLLAVAVIAIGFGLFGALNPSPNLGVLSLLTTIGGIGALLVIGIRAGSPPDLEIGGRSVKATGADISSEIGVFVALVAVIGIVAGGVIAMRGSGTTFGGALKALGDALPEEGADRSGPPQT
jgi:hypothetical protein